MKKRMLSLCLSMLCAGTLLVGGCGGNAASSTQKAGQSGAAPASTTKGAAQAEAKTTAGNSSGASGKTELTFLSWQTSYEKQNAELIQKYEELHPNIKINVKYIGAQKSADYLSAVDLMLMGKEKVDVVMTSSYANLIKRASANTYIPLDDYFAKEGKKFEDSYIVDGKYNGKVYGLPSTLTFRIVLINQKMLEEAGLSVPPVTWTWDDFREYAKKLTKGDGADKIYGSYFHNWVEYYTYGVISERDGNPLLKSETELNLDDPVISDWMKFRAAMQNDDKSLTPLSDIKSMKLDYRAQFFNGKVAMLPMGSYMLSQLNDQKNYPHDFKTTFAALPVWKGGTPGKTLGESHFYSIPTTSEHPQEAYDFIRFFTTEGEALRKVGITCAKNTDLMESVNAIIPGEDICDHKALSAVVQNKDFKINNNTPMPTWESTLEDKFMEECDLYMLGEQSLDETLKKAKQECQQIVDDGNKKK
jgi:multiple sugar transport system substrate-binding protein